jgi:hypothetical protein
MHSWHCHPVFCVERSTADWILAKSWEDRAVDADIPSRYCKSVVVRGGWLRESWIISSFSIPSLSLGKGASWVDFILPSA